MLLCKRTKNTSQHLLDAVCGLNSTRFQNKQNVNKPQQRYLRDKNMEKKVHFERFETKIIVFILFFWCVGASQKVKKIPIKNKNELTSALDMPMKKKKKKKRKGMNFRNS